MGFLLWSHERTAPQCGSRLDLQFSEYFLAALLFCDFSAELLPLCGQSLTMLSHQQLSVLAIRGLDVRLGMLQQLRRRDTATQSYARYVPVKGKRHWFGPLEK